LKNLLSLQNDQIRGIENVSENRERRLYEILTRFYFCEFLGREFFNSHRQFHQLSQKPALLVRMRFFAIIRATCMSQTATLLPSESEMAVTHKEHNPNRMFTLTRMLYTVCGASILYRVTWQLLDWYLFSKLQKGPWGLYRVDVWFYGVDFLFLLVMLAVGLCYTPNRSFFVGHLQDLLPGPSEASHWGWRAEWWRSASRSQ
jgi:hypothetical protein